jgi:methyl-accepting chemotaxis protein
MDELRVWFSLEGTGPLMGWRHREKIDLTIASEISQNVSQISSGIQEINVNIAESSQVSAEIARDIAEVNQAAARMNESSREVSENAGHLNERAVSSADLVARFKV